MCSEELTKEQKEFLEECSLEFSERFTDSDLEFKKIYDLGIPPPPIMYPWFSSGRDRYNNRDRGGNNRDRAGSSRYNDHYRDRNRGHRFEGNNYKDREHKDAYMPY